jgi:hypothetical protein
VSNDSDDRGDQQVPYGQAQQPPTPYGESAGYPGPPDPGQGYQPQGYQSQGYQPQGYQPQGYQPQGYQPQGYQPQGYPPQGYPAQAYQAQPGSAGQPAPSNGMGIAGFVTGLVGLLLCWVPFLGLILAACGIVLGALGMSQAKRTGASNGLAIAGLVLGILALIPSLIFLVAVFSLSTSP